MRKLPFRFGVVLSLALLVPFALQAASTSASGGAPDVAAFGGATVSPESVYNGTVDFTCVNADAAGSGSHVLDRDNTGIGQEALRVDITDGLGNLIYTLTYSNVLGVFAGGIGDFFYTTPPQANPITFTLTSLAGNGLPEQVDYVQSGYCQELSELVAVPALGPAGLAALALGLGAVALVVVRRARRAA